MKKLIFITAIALQLWGCGQNNNTASKADEQTAAAPSASVAQISAEIEKAPTNAELYYKRAVIYFDESKLDMALADIDQAIGLSAENPLYHFFRGRILYAMNKTIEASKSYEKAITLRPDFTEAQLKLAELYYLVKEHKKSFDVLNAVLANDKQNTEALFYRGMNYKEVGDTNAAIAAFQKAYEYDAQYYEAVMQLANLFAVLENKSALDYYIAAARLQPKNPEPPYGAGVFLQKKKQYKKAIVMYEQALKADGKFYQAYYNAGLINMEINRVNDALSNFNTVVRLAPDFADAYYMRGLCYEVLKKKEDAKLNYEYALEINPEHPLAKPALAALK